MLAQAGAAGEEHRAVGGDRLDAAAGCVHDVVVATRSDVAARRGGECVGLVHVDVSHRQTRGPGVAQMRKQLSAVSHQLSVVAALVLAAVPDVLSAQTSLSIY